MAWITVCTPLIAMKTWFSRGVTTKSQHLWCTTLSVSGLFFWYRFTKLICNNLVWHTWFSFTFFISVNCAKRQMNTAIEWRSAVFMHVACIDWTDVLQQLYLVHFAYTNMCFFCMCKCVHSFYFSNIDGRNYIPPGPGKVVWLMRASVTSPWGMIGFISWMCWQLYSAILTSTISTMLVQAILFSYLLVCLTITGNKIFFKFLKSNLNWTLHSLRHDRQLDYALGQWV